MSNRSIDSKREEFRKYLEKAGVMDTITRILTMIYENAERPVDPLQILRDEILKSSPTVLEQHVNQKYLDRANERITMLETENEKLRKELESEKLKNGLITLKINKFSPSRLPNEE